ncbi:nucleoporin NUP188 homolog [Drosophila guanche]|uniref:Nucleoporin NUP188 n=2 Tax=Drosophila guanche TaxID=7266 RepID=A0A3B0JPP1_DROGU|nr:nucleoporin NUP188 homolog [Drosophila guanche]SPP74611.1 blast:Nucleoporin NUP188 homolog [Drosophila guanche]
MPIVEKYVIKDWKRLWQMVSGIHHETPQAMVREELMSVCSELQAGVLHFKPKSASDVQLEALLRDKKQEKLLSFTERLQDLLNIESAQCWEILCYYLTQEYRGSASLLTQLISTETSMAKLLADISHYYSLERMIVLKIVKNLIVFYNVQNHPYHKEYREVVDKLTLTRLRDSYLDQLESLIDEQPPRKLAAGECFYSTDSLKAWSERNSREIKEVLHILLLMTEHLPMGLEQIKRLFSVFKQHSFGRTHKTLNEGNAYHQQLMRSLTYSEMALLLRCLDFEEPRQHGELIEQLVECLDVDITSMYHRQEHGPLLLFWMLMRLRGTNDADDASSLLRCRHLGKRAVDLKCFVELHSIVTHPMFSDDSLLSRIVRKTVYNQVGYMCDLFDGDGSCARYEGIYELLYELLSWPQLAKDFCSREETGARSLYTTLLENFPLDFTNLAKLGKALTKGGQRNYIKKQLESLPILALMYDEREHKLNEVGTDDFELTASVRPYPRIDFTIPAGTSCTAVQHPTGCYMHFRTEVNFFDSLHHEMNCLLKETGHLHGDFETNDRIRRVEAGLKFLECAVQCTQSVEGISAEMVHPTEMCIDLLNKFKTVQCPPVGLLSTCLNVCTALLPLVDEEIFARVSNLGILPSISDGSVADYKVYASGSASCFQARFLGCIIDNVEKKLERYDFLLAYLSFLRTYTKLKRNRYTQVELPGLIFVLHDVFPHVHAWHFRSDQDKNKIYFEILSYICDILDLVSTGSAPRSKDRELLLKVCIYSLLNLENGMILLRFVGVGNSYLQNSMELETNWMQQQPQGIMMLVRLSMRILMQLLRLKGTVYGDHESLSPLEALIYTQPKQRDTLRIISTVCSYMSNIFDRLLPILSCRLLKRIALEFNMSLLACLDMEPDQIRLTFIQKLPDELESDSIKIAILELVDACIAKQPGVTEAFFKVNYGQDKSSRSFFGKECQPTIGESIVTYMREFLDALEQEPLTIQQALPRKIMNIMHSLWKHNLQMLVSDLLKQSKFWQKLCSPLLGQFEPNIRVYTQILNIVSIEVYTCNGENAGLKEVLTKFFEIKHFGQWLKYVFDIPKVPAVVTSSSDELPDWICCLQAFKDLIVIMLKKQPKLMSIPEPQFKLMSNKCLTVLVDRSHYLEDMRPFIMLAELYVFILLKLNHSYTNSDKEDEELMEHLLQLMSRICSCYEDLHVRAKEACLAIITKSAHLYTRLLIRDSSISLRFLNSVVSIICSELQSMENSVSLDRRQSVESTESTGSTNSLILCLNLLKTVATTFHSEGPGNWDLPFVSVRLFQRLLRCIGHTLPLHNKHVLTVHLLDVLIVFAKSHCSVEFLHCDIGEYLWLSLKPPRELVQAKYEFNKPTADAESWTPEHWWPVYARGIELVNIIYDKHKACFLKTALQFVGIHEVYLVDAMLLSKQSLEPAAMQLIKATVSLVASLTEHHKEWAQEHKTSLMNIMRAMQSLLCHVSTLFHQQRNLKCLLAGRHCQLEIIRSTAAIVIDDDLISACNDLTDIIIFCVKSLLQFSPDLMELICSSVYEPYKWSPLLDVKFGAPKLSEENVTLTFSMILNLVSIYVKALNMQNHGFSEVPLNILPNVSHEVGEVADMESASMLQTNRTFSKTMSSTSIVSASCPASELLSNMDSHLCLLALEHLLMFVASQGIYIIRSAELEPRWKQIVRRDISNELLCFHEFVRRKVIADSRDSRSPWLRRKHGLFKLNFLDPTRSSSSPSSRSTDVVRRTSTAPANELRVNVVRRLHLQQQNRTPAAGTNNFDMTRELSPIPAGHGPTGAQHLATSSTPRLGIDGSSNDGSGELGSRKRLYPGEQLDELSALEVQYFPPPTEPGFCEQSQVQFVEEDYLKLMSLLFTVIPTTE